jgi:hypothetical protein
VHVGDDPEQPPRQPMKAKSWFGIAVSVTVLPVEYVAEQLEPQLIPDGELVIVPGPVFPTLTVKVVEVGVEVARPKLAVTVTDVLVAKVQEAVPAQPPPLQPLKIEPAEGVAARVMEVPPRYVLEQVLPQLIPAGELVTVPKPLPVLLTVTVALS